MEQRKIGRLGRVVVSSTIVGTMLLAGAATAAAHEHVAVNGQAGAGQVLANGQNHPRPFVNVGGDIWLSCEGAAAFGPAWFGLETAHHGPDSGDPGKSDGCFGADGNPAAGADDQNPAIN